MISKVCLYYCLTRIQRKDFIFAEQLLDVVLQSNYNIQDDYCFIQSLASQITQSKVFSSMKKY